MANDEKKATFPVIPNAHWWALRKKFKQSIPGVVTDNYIASTLDMKLSSARANVLPALKATKIIDQDGKPLDRATRWRDDEQYKAVCDEIRRDVYPQELLDSVPDPAKDRAAAERWFANHTGGGEAAVRKMAAFYSLLAEADPSKAIDGAETTPKRKTPSTARIESQPAAQRVRKPGPATRQGKPLPGDAEIDKRSADGPAVHINLQIHISADASTEQIDQVFASMAKHIYKKSQPE